MTNMSRARVARRIAAGAAYGGGGVGLVGAAAVGLVLAEVRMARTAVHNGNSGGRVPAADGSYGDGYGASGEPPILLTMLGDSTAAGQGVHRAAQTPGALLASGLA
ncbi:SGNH/GDSL hydrolase family protein, partial [Streptomyces hyaluromycini]